MAYNGEAALLSALDQGTRDRYIKAKAGQGIDVTDSDPQATRMGGPDPRHSPSYAASEDLGRIYNTIEAGQLPAVKALVEDECYNSTPYYLSQALERAIKAKQTPIVQYLLELGTEIDRSSVAAAVKAESLPVFDLMVRAGWDVNSPMFRGHTVLPSLVEDEVQVKWFLRQGADPNLGPPKIDQSLETAPVTGSGQCLYNAAAITSPAVIELLVHSGAKLENSTPLHAAVRRGEDSIPMIKYLLSLGVAINARADPYDQFSDGTPLESIIRNDPIDIRNHGYSFEIAKFLLENGAHPRPDNSRGIDVFEESLKSELEAIHEQHTLREQNVLQQQSPANGSTLDGN